MEDTYPKLLFRNYQQWGESSVALREKEFGIWREYTWKDCYDKVKGLFLGLTSLGIERGDKVSILGDNNPEWFWSQLAIQTAGGIVLGLNPGSSTEETKYLLQESQSRFVLAQDQEQIDKLLDLKDELPFLKRIVYWHEKGMHDYEDPILISLDDLVKTGEEYEPGHPGCFDEALRTGGGDDVAMILYTVGSDGSPKALPATHKFLLSSLETAVASNPVYSSDEYVSVISPGWFFEQVLGVGACLLAGQTLNFPENVDTAPMDSREISPHNMVYPSAVWEGIAQSIQTNVGSGTWLKRTSFKKALSLGYERVDLTLDGRQPSLFRRLAYLLANFAVIRPLKDKHGLNRARVIYAAGGPLSEETVRFYKAIEVSLTQIFGSTEGGIASEDPGDKLKLE